MKLIVRSVLPLMIFTMLSMAAAQTPVPTAPDVTPTPILIDFLVPEIINTYPHDATAFTQGLLLHDGYLYESAGLEGQSNLRKVEVATGAVVQQVDQSPEIFSEGLALVDDRLIQLTWKNQIAFVYDLETFGSIGSFTYEGEGWGLCYDGELLWLSDGTEYLTAHDPQTFEPLHDLLITYQGYPVNQVATGAGRTFDDLNELECVGDMIYANIWNTNYVVRIDKATGQVNGLVTAANLLTDAERAALPPGGVLNGIAYNPESDTFYLTGKLWPKLFEVRLIVPEGAG